MSHHRDLSDALNAASLAVARCNLSRLRHDVPTAAERAALAAACACVKEAVADRRANP